MINFNLSWVGLVSKNYEIECAIVELEKELLELKKKKISSQIEINEKEEDEAIAVEETVVGTAVAEPSIIIESEKNEAKSIKSDEAKCQPAQNEQENQ